MTNISNDAKVPKFARKFFVRHSKSSGDNQLILVSNVADSLQIFYMRKIVIEFLPTVKVILTVSSYTPFQLVVA